MGTAQRAAEHHGRLEASVDAYRVRRREAVYRWFAQRCVQTGATRVLDAGCGDGFGAAILAAAGLEVTAIDVDPDVIRAAARTYRFGRIAFKVSDATRCDEPQHSFDAIIAACLVEHLPDAQQLMGEARRLLRAGGTIAVATPNRIVASPGRTRPIAGERVWEYTPDELRSLMAWRFPAVRMLGVFHGPRLRVVERVLGSSLAVTLHRVPPPDRAAWLRLALRRMRASDFDVGPGIVRDAVDVIGVGPRP